MSLLPRLYLNYIAEYDWLVAVEFGRVDEGQPPENWVGVSEQFAFLCESGDDDARCFGFRIYDYSQFDPDAEGVAAIWDGPRFDAPVLGLVGVSAGAIVTASRALLDEEANVGRQFFEAARGASGEEALGLWLKCLHAGDSMAHFGLGYTLYELGRYQESYRHLRHYAELAPRLAWAACWYGRAAAALGETVEARTAFGQAIELEAVSGEETNAAELLALLDEGAMNSMLAVGSDTSDALPDPEFPELVIDASGGASTASEATLTPGYGPALERILSLARAAFEDPVPLPWEGSQDFARLYGRLLAQILSEANDALDPYEPVVLRATVDPSWVTSWDAEMDKASQPLDALKKVSSILEGELCYSTIAPPWATGGAQFERFYLGQAFQKFAWALRLCRTALGTDREDDPALDAVVSWARREWASETEQESGDPAPNLFFAPGEAAPPGAFLRWQCPLLLELAGIPQVSPTVPPELAADEALRMLASKSQRNSPAPEQLARLVRWVYGPLDPDEAALQWGEAYDRIPRELFELAGLQWVDWTLRSPDRVLWMLGEPADGSVDDDRRRDQRTVVGWLARDFVQNELPPNTTAALLQKPAELAAWAEAVGRRPELSELLAAE